MRKSTRGMEPPPTRCDIRAVSIPRGRKSAKFTPPPRVRLQKTTTRGFGSDLPLIVTVMSGMGHPCVVSDPTAGPNSARDPTDDSSYPTNLSLATTMYEVSQRRWRAVTSVFTG